ncbi:MAG: response regulator [Ruminococcaceae bacterium]|nr:response regulator [Oscillospiraceae bacterium]
MKHKSNLFTIKLVFWIIALVVMITVGIFFMVHALYDFQQTMIDQQEKQMLTVAKSVSSSISIYAKGYLSDITVLRSSEEFIAGYQQYQQGGSIEPLRECMQNYVKTRTPTVTGLCLLDDKGNMVTGTDGTRTYKISYTKSSNSQLFLLKNSTGYSIGISIPVYQRYWLVCLLNISDMYQRIASDIRLGEKGYVVIKASDGIILMHPAAEQIGLYVIKDRKTLHPGYDFSDLEKLISDQLAARTGVQIYHSYWWGDKQSQPVKKIAAYTPVWLQNDFLVVSAVADYQETIESLHTSMNKLFLICLLTLAGFGCLVVLLFYLLRSRHSYEMENRTLRELNSSLEELHSREEQIQHSQRLQTIGTLTSGIAHEFNNLLTPIMGYSGMLLESAEPEGELHEDLEEIFTSAQKAKEIIQQITTLSRKSVGHTFKSIELHSFLLHAVRMVRSMLPAGVLMDVNLCFKEAHILGNETQLNQVILNLCTNAFQAIGQKPDGKVTITGVVVRAQDLPAGTLTGGFEHYVQLTFRDNGCGIEKRLLDRIFDPFFTTKKTGEGTGLGLSIAQSIIEGHSGYIVVESTVGRGTVFTIYIPVNTESPAPDEKTAREEIHTDRIPIVVVDNDPRILRMIVRGLTQQGFDITSFTIPKLAADYLRKHYCAALVTDYSMPDILGTQLAMTARSHCQDIRIIVLTGLIERDIVEFKHKGIVDDYMLKPIICENLAKRLHELLI